MTTALERRIMRRVYYSYALSLFEHRMFWQGALLGACVALFGRLTHVAALYHNLLQVPLGQLPKYVFGTFEGALQNGEVVTVLVVLFMVGLSVSVARQTLTVYPIFTRPYQTS